MAAARRPGGTAAALLALHRTAGNAAVARLIGDLPVQRMTINGETIRPYGANGKALWERVRVALIDNGLSPHGARKKFTEKVKENTAWATPDGFVHQFLADAEKEAHWATTRTKEDRRSWTRRLKLNRPGWTAEHKASAAPGHDIRHVVRNATIKNALMAEYQLATRQGTALATFANLAKAVGITEERTTAWEYLKLVYDTAYLNLGNLFAGPGAINRVIGLTADEIGFRGAAFSTSDARADATFVQKEFEGIGTYVFGWYASTKAQAEAQLGPAVAARFLEGFDAFILEFEGWLFDTADRFLDEIRAGEVVLESEIGREFIDLSANFGFDLPTTSAPDTVARLIEVETFLASYPGGDLVALAKHLAQFVQLARLLQPAG